MPQRHVLILIVLVALALGARGALAAPAPTGDSTTSAQSGLPRSDWEISGTIEAMNGQFWNIQGFSIRVNDTTAVTGGIPTVGSRDADGDGDGPPGQFGHANADVDGLVAANAARHGSPRTWRRSRRSPRARGPPSPPSSSTWPGPR